MSVASLTPSRIETMTSRSMMMLCAMRLPYSDRRFRGSDTGIITLPRDNQLGHRRMHSRVRSEVGNPHFQVGTVQTAVDVNDATGHVGGRRGSQIDGACGDVLDHSNALERGQRDHLL